MAKGKKKEVLTLEERLQAALVPESEQPYQVPGNWCWVKLNSICELERGITFPASAKESELTSRNIPCLRTANIQDKLEIEDLIFVDKNYMKGDISKLIRRDDIIMSSANSRELVGKTSYIYNVPYPMTFGGFLLTIRPKNILSKYVFYFLRLEFISGHFMGESTQTTNIANINTAKLGNCFIPLPSFPEQQRVVERIESLFAKLDEARQKVQDVLDSFETRKAAILHKAFSGELTAQWRKEHGVGMEEWIDTVLSKVVTGFKYGTSEKSDYSYAGMPVFRIPNITENGLSFEDMKFLPHYDVKEESQIHENDILIIRSNGSRDLVGKSVLVPKLDVSYAYASFLIKIKPSAAIVPDFLVLYLNSIGARVQMFKKAKSSVGINNINAKELGGIALKIPSIQEQSKVVHVLDDLFAKERQAKEAAETVLEQIDLIKKSILARAFRGELGTNDPAEESALELIKQTLLETIANND